MGASTVKRTEPFLLEKAVYSMALLNFDMEKRGRIEMRIRVWMCFRYRK